MYPAFVNCTTIDWFSEWPRDALLEVAEKYLEEVRLRAEGDSEETAKELRSNVASMFVTCHRSVVDMSDRMFFEMKRHNYVTPTNYLELVGGYKKQVERDCDVIDGNFLTTCSDIPSIITLVFVVYT